MGSRLELVALLAVNVPGFPVPRVGVARGELQALVAAGAILAALFVTTEANDLVAFDTTPYV